MKRCLYTAFICGFFAGWLGCGGVSSNQFAIITRIDPAAARAGDTVTIFGSGFSEASELNIVFISDTKTFADQNSWALLPNPSGDEIESITFTVPSGIAAGTYPIYVFVSDSGAVTNTNTEITIKP